MSNILTKEELDSLFQSRIAKLFSGIKGPTGKRLRKVKLGYDMSHTYTREQQEEHDDWVDDLISGYFDWRD